MCHTHTHTHMHMHMQCNERNKETHEITLDVHITLYVCVADTHTRNVMWTSRVISHELFHVFLYFLHYIVRAQALCRLEHAIVYIF